MHVTIDFSALALIYQIAKDALHAALAGGALAAARGLARGARLVCEEPAADRRAFQLEATR